MEKKKRRLLDDIKTLRANRKTLNEFSKEKFIDSEGKANIDIYPDELYSKLSGGKEINEEILSYIDSQSYIIPSDYPINLRFHGVEEEQRGTFSKMIKDYYWLRLADTRDDLKRNSIISSILLAIGVILYAVYFLILLASGGNRPIFNEVFSVAATFSVWEAVDYFFINRSALRINQFNAAQLALLKIEYVDD